MAQFNLKLTTQGVLLLAKATAGKTLHFQAIVMGDGSYSGDPSAVQSVISPKKNLEIYRVLRDGKKVSIRGVLGLGQIDTPFWWKELGLLADDPDTGESVLAAYGNAMDKADYIAAGNVLDERIIDISLVIDESAEISADASGLIFAEEEAFQAHKADFSAHMIRLVHEKSGTTHALTGLTGVTGTVSCVFTASAAFAAGDTFTIDGTPYTIQLSNGETAEDNLFVSGAAVSIIVDTGAKKVNFKSAGGGTKLPAGTTAIVQIYTQNDTFTVPQNGKYRITVIGAGGPGGSSTYGSAAAGGGSGAWCSSVLDLKKDDAYPITVDTSQSSFSSLMTATAGQKGGKGSSGSAAGGLGGNATGGNEHNIDGNTASSTSGSSWTSGTNGANIGSPSLSKFLSSAGGVGGKSGNSSSINNAGGKPPFLVDAKFGVFGNGGGGGGAARDFDSAAPGGSGAGGAVFIELVLE